MPTGARLMSAILLGLAMAGTAYIAVYHQPSMTTSPQRLYGLAALVGAFFGWSMLGRKVGRGFVKISGWSLSTMANAGFWLLFVLAARRLYLALMVGQHRGHPVEALEALVTQIGIYAGYAADSRVLIAAALGALIAGAISEYCDMIWN